MTLDEIECLVARLEASIVTECEYERGSAKLVLRFTRPQAGTPPQAIFPQAPPSSQETRDQSGPQPVAVRSTAIGAFYRAHPLRDIPPSSAGEIVTHGQVVGYLEVDSVFSVVSSPVTGILGHPLLEDGKVVEYGQTLLTINT
ncbi:acetyl-CoA carboxylase biotin carboxyl carrier protein [Paraburkholderia sediminicola]|uniref:acetyl-CoA carboxylase biotin carboxyl carrier protein n=1 Tax=Paraburkholderia sediminicola TaxID=458836 RepID=UPI0038B97FD5